MQLDKLSYLLTLSLIHQPKKKATLAACIRYKFYHSLLELL